VYTDGGVTLFESNDASPLSSPACAFHPSFTVKKLPPFPPDEESKGADNICLVTDVRNQPHLVGFTSTTAWPFDRPDEDWVGLYKVDMAGSRLVPCKQRHMYTKSGLHVPLAGGVAFRYGAGLSIVGPSQLEFFCSARNFMGGLTATLSVNRFRS
ncbi:MAG: hypothetical protein ACRDKW_00815, partial [Actinomycetota bacterium]